jgi:DNA ligase-1
MSIVSPKLRNLKKTSYPGSPVDFIEIVEEVVLGSSAELLEYELKCLEAGYEGVMLRKPSASYKFGRSTLKEAALMKLKRFADAEAVIWGLDEQCSNQNEATKDALGRTKRSTHQANKVGKRTLGALNVRGVGGEYDGVDFNVGSGFDDTTRQMIWDQRDYFLGKTIKFKYFPTGSKEAPRFPVFLSIRED